MRRFKKILYVHDESRDTAPATFKLALKLARRNQGRIDALTVVESRRSLITTKTLTLLRARALEFAEGKLAELVDPARTDEFHTMKAVDGKPYVEIVREVLRNDYDLVIKPIAWSDLLGSMIGHTEMNLLRHCPCPVWLSKGDVFGEFDTVLAAVDGGDPEHQQVEDDLNRQILELAFSLCETSQAHLHIGHAWFPTFKSVYRNKQFNFIKDDLDKFLGSEQTAHQNWLSRLVHKAAKWIGQDSFKTVELSTHLLQGSAEVEIPKLAKKVKADLIVMGTVASGRISNLVMGNTAEIILDRIACSVLAVKPPGFVSRINLED